MLTLLFWRWEPIPTVLWNVDDPLGKVLLDGLFWLGWAILFASTFMINHFDLFGLRQMYLRLKDRPYQPVPFVEVAFYRFVRHPIMLGVLIGYWATPRMTAGHFLLAAASTVYVFIGIALEERDTHEALGEAYDSLPARDIDDPATAQTQGVRARDVLQSEAPDRDQTRCSSDACSCVCGAG